MTLASFIAGAMVGVFLGIFVMALCTVARRSDDPKSAPEPLRKAPKVEGWDEEPYTPTRFHDGGIVRKLTPEERERVQPLRRGEYVIPACKVPPEVTSRWFERHPPRCHHGVLWENRCPECEA